MTAQMIPTKKLVASPTNPRKRFVKAELEKLKSSIQSSGLIEPLVVRPMSGGKFEIVAGERRYRACSELKLKEIECMVRDLDDAQVLVIQMAENLSRSDLNAIEESEGLAQMIEAGMSPQEAAASLGIKLRWVQGRLALGELPKRAKTAVATGKLALGSAKELLKVSEEDRADALQDVMSFHEGVSEEQIRVALAQRYIEPRKRRERWRKFAESVAEKEEVMTCIDDPERWGEYVMPYGEGRNGLKVVGEAIGKRAARPEDEGVTWGQLAFAHGIEILLVPCGGVTEKMDNIVRLVDSAAVVAAEKVALKSEGAATIGPRKGGQVLPEPKDEYEADSEEDEDDEEFPDEENQTDLTDQEAEYHDLFFDRMSLDDFRELVCGAQESDLICEGAFLAKHLMQGIPGGDTRKNDYACYIFDLLTVAIGAGGVSREMAGSFLELIGLELNSEEGSES